MTLGNSHEVATSAGENEDTQRVKTAGEGRGGAGEVANADPGISRLLTKYKDMAKDKDLAQESYFGGGNGPAISKHFVSHADQKDCTVNNQIKVNKLQETDA